VKKGNRQRPALPRAIGYIRVSTEEQVESGAGLEAQRTAISQECERRSWPLLRIAEDAGVSGKRIDNRPELNAALDVLKAGEAEVLVVAKLNRLSRSLVDAASVMARSEREGWSLVALDLGVDTTTAQGQLVCHVMASFAEFERKLIGERTKAAMATLKARGVRVGRPRSLPDDVIDRIIRERSGGATLTALAERLTAEGVPTAHGSDRWYPSTVRGVLISEAGRRDQEAGRS
jgi:DNA invertase Pin-like site-specific DNA recombinase